MADPNYSQLIERTNKALENAYSDQSVGYYVDGFLNYISKNAHACNGFGDTFQAANQKIYEEHLSNFESPVKEAIQKTHKLIRENSKEFSKQAIFSINDALSRSDILYEASCYSLHDQCRDAKITFPIEYIYSTMELSKNRKQWNFRLSTILSFDGPFPDKVEIKLWTHPAVQCQYLEKIILDAFEKTNHSLSAHHKNYQQLQATKNQLMGLISKIEQFK